MRYALLGAVVGALLGAGSGEPAGIIVLAVVGMLLGVAYARQKKDAREEAARAARQDEAKARTATLRSGIRAHLAGAAERGLIDPDTLARLLADLEGALPSATAAAPTAGTADHRASAPLAMRMSPDAAARPLRMIRQGAPLWVVRREGSWVLVRCEDGTTAWVVGRLLEATSAAPGAAAVPAPVEPVVPIEPEAPAEPAVPVEPEAAAEPAAPPEAEPPPRREVPPRPVAPRPTPPRPTRPATVRSGGRRTVAPAPAGARPAGAIAPAAPQAPSRLEVSFGQISAAAGRAWKSFTADVAIHTLIYVGVLLLIVVMFVFFAFGYYGDVVSAEAWRPWRPVVTLAIPILLFGTAWMLRSQTGIPFTANAIGLVAALSLPIMLSALFQDGVAWPSPDLDGPARWFGYSAVGLVITIVYWVAARRAAWYGYLIGLGIWTAVGALALYLEEGIDLLGESGVSFDSFEASDGISGMQMTAVVAAIAVTVPIVSRFRRSDFGKAVALRTVRAAAVCLPVMACLAVVFAYSDARVGGIARPTLEDIGAVTVATLALAGAAMLWIRRAEYAGEGLGPKVQRFMGDALAGLGHLALVAAWLLSIGTGLDPAWAGVGLVGYAVVLEIWGTHLGLRSIAALWAARSAAAVGLVLALAGPVPTIVAWGAVAAAATLAEAIPGSAERFRRQMVVGENPLARLGLVVVPFGVALSGVARLVPAPAVSWVVLAGGAALVAYRWLPGVVLPLSAGLPAGAAVLTAVGLEIGRTVDAGSGAAGADTVPLGLLLLTGALVAGVLRVPAAVRFPFVASMATAGVTLVLRELVDNPVVADAGVVALAGAGLTIAAVVAYRSPWARASDVLGHLGAYASLIIAATGDSRTAMVAGLGAMVVVHGLGAWTADQERSPLGVTEAGATVNAVLQGVVASAAVPVLATMAADAFTWVRDDQPRAGLILAAVAWIYVIGLRFIGTRPLRRVMTIGSYAVAAAGIAVTATSLTESLLSVWSAAAVTGLVARFERSPARSAPTWILGATAVVLTAARAGVDRNDLHFVIFGIGLLLAIVPVAMDHRDRLASHWLHPPLALGLLLMPVGVGFAIADTDRRLLAVLALAAAASYVAIGILLRFGGFSLPATLMTGVAYADLMEDWVNPFDRPLAWMPLAAAFAVGGMVSPGRVFAKGDAGFGLLVGWWATAGLAVVLGFQEGQLDWILLVDAVLLSGYGLAARSLPFWYIGLALYGVAGALFGTGWLALALAGMAAAVAGHAVLRDDRVSRTLLVPGSLVLASSSFATLGVWQEWTAGEAVGYSLLTAVLVGAASGVASLRSLPSRVVMWVDPVQLVAQIGLTGVMVIALIRVGDADVGWVWTGFSVPEAWLTLAAVLGFEATLVGVGGTVWRKQMAVWASAGLAAGSIGMLLAWADPTAGTLVAVLLIAGAGISVVAAAVLFIRLPERVRFWVWPVQAVGQLGLMTALAAALLRIVGSEISGWAGLGMGDAELTVAGVLGFEAILVGVAGTVMRREEAPWVSVALGAGSIAMIGAWAGWSAGTVVAFAGLAGGVVASAAATVFSRHLSDRLAMWVYPVEALGQLGLLVALSVSAGRLDAGALPVGWEGFSVGAAQLAVAGVLAFESALVGAVGTVNRLAGWPWVSMALGAGSIAMLLARLDPTAGELTGMLLAAGVVVAVLAAWAMVAPLPERAAMWAGPLQGLGQLGLVAVAWAALLRIQGSEISAWEGLAVGESQLLLAGVLGFEAVLVGVVGTLRKHPVAPWVSVTLAAGSWAMVAVWASWGPGAAWTAFGPPGAFLALATVVLALRGAGGRLGMWVAPVHALGQAGVLASGIIALASFGAPGIAGSWAALLGWEAALLAVAAPLVPEDLTPREVASILAVASLLCAVGSVETSAARGIVLQVVAILGAVTLVFAEDLRDSHGEWYPAAWVFGVGAVAGTVILAATLLGPLAGATAGALAIGGGGLVAGGLRTGRWPVAYLGLLMMLGAALIAGRDLLDGNRHAYAVSIAVVLLVILDMERIRMTRTDHPGRVERLNLIRVTEFVVVGVPLVMAGGDAVRDIGYTALLAVEAVIVLLWAIASQVKRRLLIGVLALVAAIMIPAVVLAVEAGSGGVSTAAILGISAIVAVVFIVIGSLLERGRARVNLAVKRVSEILEEWE